MTIRHIKIFLAVCGHDCNVTRAAEFLHMSQPAVSLALKEMEEYYGTTLFERNGRHLVLVEAGKPTVPSVSAQALRSGPSFFRIM